MGATKTEGYTAFQVSVASLAKALGHPGRIAILQELLASEKCQCGQLADQVGLAQSTVSQHLKELKQAGLIQGKIEGDKPCYCLSPANSGQLISFLQDLQEASEKQIPNC